MLMKTWYCPTANEDVVLSNRPTEPMDGTIRIFTYDHFQIQPYAILNETALHLGQRQHAFELRHW
jgi:hypothetical protein